MAEIPTFPELYAAAQAEIQTRNSTLTDFNEGSVLDAVAGASGVLSDEVARLLVQLFESQFFATATGSDLDDLAQDRLQLTRNTAGTAIVTLTWTRVAAGSYLIPAGTAFSAVNNNGEIVTFSSTAGVTVNPGDVTVSVAVIADVAGRGSNVEANTITTVVDTVLSDPSATVTNAARAAGGSDAETDEEFRERIRLFYTSLRRGTKAALRTGALTVAGVSVVTIDEQYPITFVYVGDPDGSGNQTLADNVATELENWRAAGSFVQVLPASREELPLSLAVVLTELPTDVTALRDAIRASIVAFGDTLDVGAVAYATEIECAAKEADDARIRSVTGAADLTPAAAQNAIRFVASSIAVSFTVE